MIKYLENNDLNKEIESGVWLVDFYADWCGPCKMLGVVLEKINANILKVNVDNFSDLAREFGVMSIPTMCFFKDGQLREKIIGFRSKEEIEDILNNLK